MYMDRHPGINNMAFVDGGARSIDIDELWDQIWHANYDDTVTKPASLN
jgi:prepilin-type processing-associated H-X9-DG protein